MTQQASQDGQRRPTVYRVQAADGRGPWRPGMSHLWHDEAKTYLPDSIVDAFGLDWRGEIPDSWACGCACRSLDGLLKWFTPLERRRLDRMGYAPVAIRADKIIRENADQVIFAPRPADRWGESAALVRPRLEQRGNQPDPLPEVRQELHGLRLHGVPVTITLPWWLIPIGLFIAGVITARIFGREKGNYDMVSPIIGAACFLIGTVGALAFLVGRWLA